MSTEEERIEEHKEAFWGDGHVGCFGHGRSCPGVYICPPFPTCIFKYVQLVICRLDFRNYLFFYLFIFLMVLFIPLPDQKDWSDWSLVHDTRAAVLRAGMY